MVSKLLEPLPASEWDRRKARHILRRAGFGVPMTRFEALSKMGASEAVSYFLDYKKFPETMAEPDWLEPVNAEREMRGQIGRLYAMNQKDHVASEEDKMALEMERRKLVGELQREERQDVERMKGWWLKRMLTTQRPLQEKMTLFWHGHFATSAQKVKSGMANYQINKLFRDNATGNFKMLAYEVGVSAAMMRYLDNAQNNKNHPNENWARELMELFTLGQKQYTEDDIKNSARAFTGWASDGEDFVFRPALHDNSEKVFMGRKGNLNGNDIIDIIFEQPAASRFITTKLWNYFAYDEPEPEVIEGLAETLRKSGYELRPMLEQMFRSKAFYSEKAIETQIKSPVEVAVTMLSYLDIVPEGMVERYVVNSLRLMGQDLFYPPNVKGWPGGRTWISTNTLMVRYNLSNFLVQGVVTDAGQLGPRFQQVLKKQRDMLAAGKNGKRTPAQLAANMMERGGMDEMGAEQMEMTGNVGTVGDATGPKGFQLPVAPFKAKDFFGRAKSIPVSQVADFLADYLYGISVRDDQRRKVVEALVGDSNPAVPLNASSWDEGRLRGAMHLMLSTAEFQLC